MPFGGGGGFAGAPLAASWYCFQSSNSGSPSGLASKKPCTNSARRRLRYARSTSCRDRRGADYGSVGWERQASHRNMWSLRHLAVYLSAVRSRGALQKQRACDSRQRSRTHHRDVLETAGTGAARRATAHLRPHDIARSRVGYTCNNRQVARRAWGEHLSPMCPGCN